MRSLALFSVAIGLVSCATARRVAPLRYSPEEQAQRASFASAPPPRRAPVSEIVDVAPRITMLPNGLRVLLLERHAFPVVAARLFADRGSIDLDDAGEIRVAQTNHLFGRGGSEATFEGISADAARIGASFATGEHAMAVWASVKSPAPEFEAALDLLTRLTFKAQLAAEEYRRREVEWVQQSSFLALNLDAAERYVLFGASHPYGFAGRGRQVIPLEVAQTIHQALLQPSHSTLVVVGDVTPERLDSAVAGAFALWSAAAPPLPKRTEAPVQRGGPRLSIVSRPGNAQMQGSVFARGPLPSDDDSIAFSVAASLLGGGQSSRLYEVLREETGAAYNVGATAFLERNASWMSVAASYDIGKAVQGVGAVLAAVRDLRAGVVTDDQIAAAREAFLADLREYVATVQGTAAFYAFWWEVGIEPERARRLPELIAAVRRQDVVRVANEYLGEGALHVVFMGDDRWFDPRALGMGRMATLDMPR